MSRVEDVAGHLRAGHLAVIPTDTVYGLAAHLDHPAAIQEIFVAKGRPPEKPIPVLGADLEQLASIAQFDERAKKLATRFWPGPLTIILPRVEGFDIDLGGDERRTVGVRVPKEPRTLELLRHTGPLAVTSANRSGEKEATTIEDARDALGDAAIAYLDGGRCVGTPSTIVFLVGERRLLREGPIPSALVTQILSE